MGAPRALRAAGRRSAIRRPYPHGAAPERRAGMLDLLRHRYCKRSRVRRSAYGYLLTIVPAMRRRAWTRHLIMLPCVHGLAFFVCLYHALPWTGTAGIAT